MLYLLQDSNSEQIQELLGFSLVCPMRTVKVLLEENNKLDLLSDPKLNLATSEIKPEGKDRPQINFEIKQKENAITYLAKKYSDSSCSEEQIRCAILSIGDNHSYLTFNERPIEYLLDNLLKYFHPDVAIQPFTLAIVAGRNGARLTHTHTTQYTYVLQSLTLWRQIVNNKYQQATNYLYIYVYIYY
jgi:hypothetical protein